MVVLDSSILIKLFGQRVTGLEKKKLEYLVRTLEEARERIIIPTPALAEYLARAGEAAAGVLEQLRKRSVFYIAPFDQKAAVESALALNKDLTAGDKRGGSKAITWAKVKFDRQIVAIALANGAAQIYSEDDDIRRLAKKAGIRALSIADIDLPQSERQQHLFDDESPPK